MKLVAQARATSPEAEITLVENYIFPSIEMCRKLREEKKILAGGPISGTIGIAMIVEAASALELEGVNSRLERNNADAHK